MYSATDSGTKPASDSPAAVARRIVVDETGAVGASTKKITGCEGMLHGVSRNRGARLGNVPRTAVTDAPGRDTTTK